MASDLSKIIPENLSTTLSALLAKDTKLIECTQVDKRDFENIELLRIDVEFVFDKLTTHLSYYIPAQSASKIFNIMMAAPDGDILTKIDDDTADAMAEFISNTCGGLVTTINASEFEDIGKAKFNIKHKETLDGNSIESIENTYRFLIDIDGSDSLIFTKFEENFIEFITELTNTEPTYYPEVIKEEIEEEVIENEEQANDTPIEETSKEEPIDNSKDKKFKKIIMIVSALIVTTILLGIIMYISGVFDPEPIEKPKDINSTVVEKNNVDVIQYKPLKKVDFKMSDIDTQRVNNKLDLLTKYQVLTQEELETQALEEKQRIIQLKKEQLLIEFAKQNKEEPLVIEQKKESTNTTVTENKTEEKTDTNMDTPNVVETKTEQPVEDTTTHVVEPNDKLKFVLANSLKYKLFKELVLQTNSTQARISICNDDNGKTQIFIGPFENEELQIQMNTLIRESNTNTQTIIENITQEEFDTKCNF
jgi:hypothetical protein